MNVLMRIKHLPVKQHFTRMLMHTFSSHDIVFQLRCFQSKFRCQTPIKSNQINPWQNNNASNRPENNLDHQIRVKFHGCLRSFKMYSAVLRKSLLVLVKAKLIKFLVAVVPWIASSFIIFGAESYRELCTVEGVHQPPLAYMMCISRGACMSCFSILHPTPR